MSTNKNITLPFSVFTKCREYLHRAEPLIVNICLNSPSPTHDVTDIYSLLQDKTSQEPTPASRLDLLSLTISYHMESKYRSQNTFLK